MSQLKISLSNTIKGIVFEDFQQEVELALDAVREAVKGLAKPPKFSFSIDVEDDED